MRSRSLLAMVGPWLAGCGFTGSNTSTKPDAAMVDAAKSIDAPADGKLCFGSGLATVCLSSVPPGPIVLPNGTFDTGVATTCTEVIAIGGVDTCVIAGTDVTVLVGTLYRGVGNRPLVVVATGTLTVAGTLSVSSRRTLTPGAGAPIATCTPAAAAEADSGGAGGGAGGSFLELGGVGGVGDTNDSGGPPGTGTAGSPAAAIQPPTAIRAGCPGGGGGAGTGAGGSAGAGGGAVYLIAGTQIAIPGGVFAVGEGGGGGGVTGGGGGGGSGGLIGLDSSMIDITGAVTANGGAGGEGGGFTSGNPGSDGSGSAVGAPGGAMGDTDGGNGGDGSGLAAVVGANGDPALGGGGGGGGGAGFVYLKGARAGTGTISPAPSLN